MVNRKVKLSVMNNKKKKKHKLWNLNANNIFINKNRRKIQSNNEICFKFRKKTLSKQKNKKKTNNFRYFSIINKIYFNVIKNKKKKTANKMDVKFRIF